MYLRRLLGQVVTLYLAGELFLQSALALLQNPKGTGKAPRARHLQTAGVFITAVIEDTEGVTIILVYISQ